MAWALRRLPVFPVLRRGDYPVQPIYAGDLAWTLRIFESRAVWYDKPSPTLVDAIALVRRHLWLMSEVFSRSGVEPDTHKVQPLVTIHS